VKKPKGSADNDDAEESGRGEQGNRAGKDSPSLHSKGTPSLDGLEPSVHRTKGEMQAKSERII